MRRITVGIAVLALLVLSALGGWRLGRSPLEATILDLQTRLESAQDTLDTSREELANSLRESKRSAEESKLQRKRVKRLRSLLSAQKIRGQRLRGLENALASGRGRVRSARLVSSSSSDLLVVARNRRFYPGGASGSSLDVWRLTDGIAWELIFRLAPDPRTEVMLVGPPGSERRETSDAYSVWLNGAGDVTGDGLPDLAIQQWNTGSGGCGVARVLENNAQGLSEIFRRERCDHTIGIDRGHVVYRHAISPKGCTTAHGCGFKRIWVAWDGDSWDVVRIKRKTYS